MEAITYDLAIVGGGPAGSTAAIYAGRSGLRTVMLDKQMSGGQVMTSPKIENWPGSKGISGPDLAQSMRGHAEAYCDIKEFSEVLSIRKDGPFLMETNDGKVRSKAVIIATGAHHKKLGAPGEERLSGRGVSYCATCDGFFFKGKDVAVIGGGNTAFLYAEYLNNIGCRVKLIHRRDCFRAEKALQDQVRSLGIELVTEMTVEEFVGDEVLEKVRLRSARDEEVREIELSGAFIAIGEEPESGVARALGLEMNEEGYIKVDGKMRTSMPGVFAAGDITGGLKQIVVAAGQGALAATTAFQELMRPYWI